MFSSLSNTEIIILATVDLSSVNAFNLVKAKILTLGNESIKEKIHVLATFFPEVFTTQSQLSTTLCKKPFENIVGKEENAGNPHFLLFPQCFLPIPYKISIFDSHSFCCLQMFTIWTCLKFCLVQS